MLHGCAGSGCGESQGPWRSSHGMTGKELTSGWMGLKLNLLVSRVLSCIPHVLERRRGGSKAAKCLLK